MDDHPSRPLEGDGAGSRRLPAAYLDLAGPGQRSCLALHRTGFAWPPRHRDAGALLPHPFTFACAQLTCGRAIGRVFLWHFPAGFPGWALPTVLALRCPDFPRRVFSPSAAVRPTTQMIRPDRSGSGSRGSRERAFRLFASRRSPGRPALPRSSESAPFHRSRAGGGDGPPRERSSSRSHPRRAGRPRFPRRRPPAAA